MWSMGGIIAIVAIVMGCLTSIVKMIMRNKSKVHQSEISRLEGELSQTQAHCQRLEERVAVLERIVTDSGFETQQEISRLG
ncbi:hypothetical protein [Ferrimonas aestuarii]|uniref:Phage shock protein B n=1 Tax=Ferrimonas aestuarii TaxID=2569539 RepID=A0A4U1BQX7_9GAMM|nr:hypothetical protein [Ferrimonas aestuarii]TKB56752.1 hypothetical protein FCL42_06370 [Ferrimonas aestuarii]